MYKIGLLSLCFLTFSCYSEQTELNSSLWASVRQDPKYTELIIIQNNQEFNVSSMGIHGLNPDIEFERGSNGEILNLDRDVIISLIDDNSLSLMHKGNKSYFTKLRDIKNGVNYYYDQDSFFLRATKVIPGYKYSSRSYQIK